MTSAGFETAVPKKLAVAHLNSIHHSYRDWR